jgi:F-type H+-transporting ATPase subunit delta
VSINRTDALQISRRYGAAIFALAAEVKKESVVVGEFGVLAAAIDSSADLADALSSPLVSPAQKSATLAALIAKADPLTKRAVETIAAGGRAQVIPAIAESLKAMLAAHQGEVEALVTSARALNAATQKQLAASLAKATGKKVTLTLKEDANVLGGLMVELGSLRLDATLSGALNHMRERLLAPTH